MKTLSKRLLGLGTCLAVLAGTAAQADSYNNTTPVWADWYAGISGDYTWMHGDSGGGGNAQLGSQFWSNGFGDLRLEGEAGYHDVASPSEHFWTYMGNAYFDFRSVNWFGPQIFPYIGAGVGDATVHNDGSSSNTLAYQFMGGLAYAMPSMPNSEWTLGYRYIGSDEVNGERLNANNIELGMRMHF